MLIISIIINIWCAESAFKKRWNNRDGYFCLYAPHTVSVFLILNKLCACFLLKALTNKPSSKTSWEGDVPSDMCDQLYKEPAVWSCKEQNLVTVSVVYSYNCEWVQIGSCLTSTHEQWKRRSEWFPCILRTWYMAWKTKSSSRFVKTNRLSNYVCNLHLTNGDIFRLLLLWTFQRTIDIVTSGSCIF